MARRLTLGVPVLSRQHCALESKVCVGQVSAIEQSKRQRTAFCNFKDKDGNQMKFARVSAGSKALVSVVGLTQHVTTGSVSQAAAAADRYSQSRSSVVIPRGSPGTAFCPCTATMDVD